MIKITLLKRGHFCAKCPRRLGKGVITPIIRCLGQWVEIFDGGVSLRFAIVLPNQDGIYHDGAMYMECVFTDSYFEVTQF